MVTTIKRIVLAIGLLGVLSGNAFATNYVSTATGTWDNSSIWSPSGVPASGDTADIQSGHTVTVTSSVTVGATTGTAPGIRIRGTNSTVYGKLVVNDAVTLTMKGVTDSATYVALKIDRYAVFEPQPGSRIEVDCEVPVASYYNNSTRIVNQGIINAIGTQAKPITFSVPAANISWDNTVAAATYTFTTGNWRYDKADNVAVVQPGYSGSAAPIRFSNAAGTGIGSIGDTSLTIDNVTPATILQTEVATLAAVDAAGEYFVNYATGAIFFHHVYTNGNPSFDLAYKKLSARTTGEDNRGLVIDSISDWDYNEFKADHCIFEYLGRYHNSNWAPGILLSYKGAGLGSNRQAYVKNSTIRYGAIVIRLKDSVVGTAADPVLFDNNILTGNEGNIGFQTPPILIGGTYSTNNNAYITFSNNTINGEGFINVTGGGTYTQTKERISNLSVTNNTAFGMHEFIADYTPPSFELYDGTVSNNVIDGVGSAVAWVRFFLDVRGTADHPLVIDSNTLSHSQFAVTPNYWTTFTKNFVDQYYQAGVTYSVGYKGRVYHVIAQNNILVGAGESGSTTEAFLLKPSADMKEVWYDNVIITNNTVVNSATASTGVSLGSNGLWSYGSDIVFANNIVYGGQYAASRSTYIFDGALNQLDNNVYYNQSSAVYSGLNTKATSTFLQSNANYNQSSTRNVLGVDLWNPTYTTAQAARSLTYTVNVADNDVTLAWGSGSAVQLVWQGTSTLTSDAARDSGWTTKECVVFSDTAQTWATDLSGSTLAAPPHSANNPMMKWVKFLTGASAGNVGVITRATSATQVRYIPASISDALPVTGDQYVIYKGMVELNDGGTDNVWAGIDLRTLPASSQTDTGISVSVAGAVLTDPLIVDVTGSAVTDFQTASNGSGVDKGTTVNAPATDYWGTTRPYNGYVDIGVFEYYVAPATGISDLAVAQTDWNKVVLQWTVPGSVSDVQQAYDIRYSTSAITEANFSSATQWTTTAPKPIHGGNSRIQQAGVFGLDNSTTYYFAMKSQAADNTWGGMSNLVSSTTSSYPSPAPTSVSACSDVLNTAGGSYILTANLNCSGSGPQITANNVTFDLNGKTIVYDNNASAIAVPNAGFESALTGNWDVTGATSVARHSNTESWSYGEWHAGVDSAAAVDQVMVSDWTYFPANSKGIMYRTQHGGDTYPSTTILMEVLDSTSSVIATSTAAQTLSFTSPVGGGNVKARITIPSAILANAPTQPFRFDEVGICRDGSGTGENIVGVYVNRVNGNGITIKNGSIIQGNGNSCYSKAISFYPGNYSDTVQDLYISNGGIESRAIQDAYGYGVVVERNYIVSTSPFVFNRTGSQTVIDFAPDGSGSTGNSVRYNTIASSTGMGNVTTNIYGETYNNYLQNNCSNTNKHAVSARHHAVIKDNYIYANPGQGIYIGGTNTGPVANDNVAVHHNMIVLNSHEPNLEYPCMRYDAIKLNDYSDTSASYQLIRNTLVYENDIYVYGQSKAFYQHYCANTAYSTPGVPNHPGIDMNGIITVAYGVGNQVYNNRITATAIDNDATVSTIVAGSYDNVVTFDNNTLTSNINIVKYAGYTGHCDNSLFTNNTLVKSGSEVGLHARLDQAYPTTLTGFQTISGNDKGSGAAGYAYVTGLVFQDTTLSGGAALDNTSSYITAIDNAWNYSIKWTLNLTVLAAGLPLSGATVTITNVGDNTVYTSTTNASGTLDTAPVLIQDVWSGPSGASRTKTAHTPHVVTVSKSGYTTAVVGYTMSATTTDTISLSAPTGESGLPVSIIPSIRGTFR